MATSAVLRYNMNKITCYLDHARVAKCSASSGFNSVLHVPPLGPPILEPGLHLRVRHLQIFGHLRAFRARQVFLSTEECHQSTGR
jgi:hypothetical protein